MFNFILTTIGLICLLVGIGSIYILYKIGGSSDGPGAIIFYIGAFLGLAGAWVFLTTGKGE